MKTTWWICVAALAIATPLSAAAQDTILIFETRFDGEISGTMEVLFRDALAEGLNAAGAHEALHESVSRQRLGAEANRLMTCAADPACLLDAGMASGAEGGVIATVAETGGIYTFTIDVYNLTTGEGVTFDDADCALCTVDEAVSALRTLATSVAGELPALSAASAATPSTTMLRIEAHPTEADIRLDHEWLGTGMAEVAVEPGTHDLVVSLEGHRTVSRQIPVAEGEEPLEVVVRLQEDEEEEGEGEEDNARYVGSRPGGPFGADTTIWGSILMGTGLVSLATGVVLITIDGDTTCSDGAPETCPEVFNTRAGGTALTIAGTAAVTAGLLFLLWESLSAQPAEPGETSAAFGVGLGPEGAAVLCSGSF